MLRDNNYMKNQHGESGENFYSLVASCHHYFQSVGSQCHPNVSYFGYFSSWLFIILTIGGLCNNLLSLIVFCASKFNARVFSFLLRFFFITNLAVAVTALSPQIYYGSTYRKHHPTPLRISQFVNVILLQTSHGVLALMCAARIIYSRFRSMATSKAAYYSCYIAIMVIITTSAGLNFTILINQSNIVNEIPHFSHYLVTVSITIICFVLWAIGSDKWMRPNNQAEVPKTKTKDTSNKNTNAGLSKKMTEVMSRYIMLSAGLCVITTVPAVVFAFIPTKVMKPLDCTQCIHFSRANYFFEYCIYTNAYADNVLFSMLIPHYRTDLAVGVRHIFGWFKNSSRKISASLSSSDSGKKQRPKT